MKRVMLSLPEEMIILIEKEREERSRDYTRNCQSNS